MLELWSVALVILSLPSVQDSTASTSPMSKFEVLGEGDSFGPRLRWSFNVY